MLVRVTYTVSGTDEGYARTRLVCGVFFLSGKLVPGRCAVCEVRQTAKANARTRNVQFVPELASHLPTSSDMCSADVGTS
eukprot:413421-Rhodomonas_salina.2